MNVELDIRVVELLCSRLCHELVSPVGAINNGVELIEEMGSDMVDEAVGLIAHSASQASRRLQVLRLAYGAAGAESATGFRDVRQAAANYFAEAKTTLDWPPEPLDEALTSRRGLAKVVLNLLVLAEEALAYGGTITVGHSAREITVTASGRAAGLKPEIRRALDGATQPAELGPRTVHAYATGRFAASYGLALTVSEEPDRLALGVSA